MPFLGKSSDTAWARLRPDSRAEGIMVTVRHKDHHKGGAGLQGALGGVRDMGHHHSLRVEGSGARSRLQDRVTWVVGEARGGRLHIRPSSRAKPDLYGCHQAWLSVTGVPVKHSR